ncbi:MAG: hypothetical protein H6838_18110 [Planctomycetes bacterium]|nr:hypothetical protein [Planctomycetota bacterium]MCB9887411.1 hypothetical protein [Planctomycetota bacterium]
MLITRKIGAVLRGKATPRQVLLATVLGGALGFVPGFFLPGDLGGGFAQAPGLILTLTCLVLVLNANLAVFGLVTLFAKLLSLLLLPVSYAVGTFLLEGPLRGLFAALVNARFTAWFGFEYYATTGGLVVGLVFGVVVGVALNRAIRGLRQRMAGLEENSERYQKLSGKRSVRLLTWALLGKGKGKQSWADLAASTKKGLPIRVFGVALVVVGLASLWVFQQWFSQPILTSNLQAGLQRANGATVDLGAAALDLDAGRVRIEDLHIADASDLGRDVFAAAGLVATIDTGELLRKRFVIDELRATDARSGTSREVPGVLVSKPAPPAPPPPPAGTKTIEDYLADYELYKLRFEQVRDWLQMIGGDDAGTPPQQKTPEVIAEERRQQAEEVGMARVVATHLLEGAPRVLIRKIDIEGIAITIDGVAEKLDLRGRNVSTDPGLVADAMSLGLTAQSDKLQFTFAGGTAAQPGVGLQFALRRLAVDDVFGKLKLGGKAPLRGGNMDLGASGRLTAGGDGLSVELPLQVELRDTLFAFPGAKETKVENLLLPIGVRGPLLRPSVTLDDQALQQALLKAGKQELANFVGAHAGKLLEGAPAALQGIVDPNKSPEQMLDAAQQAAKKAADEAKAKAEAEAKKAAEEAANKLLPGGVQGLLPGQKKKN